VRRAALISALSLRAGETQPWSEGTARTGLVVLEHLNLGEIKTKQMAQVLKNLKIDGVTCVVGLGKNDIDEKRTIYLSGRNIRGLDVTPANQLNAYTVLRPKRLLLTKAALTELCKTAKWK
jgi:large subunit ribosomal protein L4